MVTPWVTSGAECQGLVDVQKGSRQSFGLLWREKKASKCRWERVLLWMKG